jgi:hypothetical protein
LFHGPTILDEKKVTLCNSTAFVAIEAMGVLASPLALMLINDLLLSKWDCCILTAFTLLKQYIASTLA